MLSPSSRKFILKFQNNDKLVGRIEAEKNAAEKAHQERLKTLDENITRIGNR